MSYCRWSSDFGECDVYVYEDVNGGWTTHVAGRRLKHRVPDEIRNMPTRDKDGKFDGDLWFEQKEAIDKWRESLPCDEHPCTYTDGKKEWQGAIRTPKDSEYIDLSEISEFAGMSFNDPTPGDCAIRLLEIRESGLNVPQYAIDELLSEDQADPNPEGEK
jgi:hypothetical protein